jgi:PAS domain S-box-containing protein
MKILHLEDNPADAELVRDILLGEFPACSIDVVETRERFLAALAPGGVPDLIVSDFSLPAFDGLSALKLVRERALDVPFVFVSGSIGEERAISSIRAGAYDYVLKDNMARLPVVIRRALADAFQRRLRELAGIIERAAEAIVVTDLEGRVTLWNHGATLLYGVPDGETVGRLAEDLLPASMRDELQAGRAAVLEKGAWRHELAVTTRDGRDIVVDLHVTLVRDEAGQPSARLTLGTDITEKRKLEEQFLRAQRLESLGLLAAGIAHDLNNVLAPVLMSAPLLRQHVTEPGALHVLDILEKSAERGSALVRHILGFAHGVGGEPRLTQVKHLLRDISDVVQASFPKSIVLEEELAPDLWPIQANPTQIHQILLNLAVNARDAMLPRGGTLRLRAENRILDEVTALAFEGARPGAFLVLEVGDTGSGIPPEVLARIWEPFFTTKGEGKGTGLGLSTVRGIAAAHRGFIALETKVGRGTTFRVFLPAEAPAQDADAEIVATQLLRGHGELILVVDDEVDVRSITTAILNQRGYRAISCGDGVEAIAAFTERSAEIKLVISDLNMPNLDGPALALILRRLRPDLKIVVMTGFGSASRHTSTDPFPAATIDARLQKPFTVEMLLTTVRDTLQPPGPAVPPA